MKIYDESLYCAECDEEISIQEDLFNGHICEECAFATDEKCESCGERKLTVLFAEDYNVNLCAECFSAFESENDYSRKDRENV